MKKKLIISVLAALASLTCFTACDAIDKVTGWFKPNTQTSESSSDTPVEGEIDLAGAKDYADYMFRTSNASVREDYEVPNTLSYDGNDYPLAWTVNVPTGVVVNKQADKTIIDVDENLSEDLQYTLTLTISNPNDATDTVSVTFNRTVLAAPTKVPAKITAAPVEEKAYKLHIYHAQLQADYYMTGDIYKTYEYYFDITTDFDKAIDVYVEAVENEEGMFYMYHNGTTALTGKHYINARKTSDNKHISNYFETTPETKWFFDEEIGTMVTIINDLDGNDTKFYLGCDTDTSHKSISPQSGSENNKGCLIEMVDRTTVSNAYKIEKTKQELTLSAAVHVGAGSLDLATMGNTFPDATIAWAVSENTFASVENGQLVINTAPTAATTLTLTATISCGDATSATKELSIKVIPNENDAIIDALYALKSGEDFANKVTLTGVVSSFMKVSSTEDGTYNSQYGNISVNLLVPYGDTYKTVGCYHLKSDGTSGISESQIAVGYTLTVTGMLTNHNGNYQFNYDCTYGACVAGTEENVPSVDTTLDTPQEIMDAAYALATDTALEGTYTLTGVITAAGDYSTQYSNITVTMTVNGVTGDNASIECYRLSGTGADVIDVGYTITVTGSISKYSSGKVQFNAATLDSYVAPELTDADKVQQAIDEISIPVVYVGETTYTLPTTGKHDSAIAWSGEGVAENVLSANATTATEVTLTATVTLNDATNNTTVVVKLIPNDKAAIATAAAALQSGESFANAATLTGTVSEIVKAYDSNYGNITVNMVIADTETIIQCYRMVGGENLAVDTVITVTGMIKNYKGTLEFDAKCTYVEGDGVTYDELTIPEALEIGNGLENYGATTTAYYVTGTIVNIANATYNNLYIADANGNVIYVYGVTTETTLAVGQQVKLLGVVSKHSNVAQLKETKAVEVTESTLNDAQKVLADKYVLTTTTDVKENGTVALTVTGTYGSTIAWSISESEAAALSADGNSITYTLPATATTVTLTATLTSGEAIETSTFTVNVAAAPQEGTITVTADMTTFATANSWTSSANVAKTAVALDEVASFTIAGGSNSGKYYSDGIRIYATDSPAGSLTISVKEGYELVSVKISTRTGTYAFLQLADDTTEDYSNKVANVSGSSVTFNSVKNGFDGKQVRVTAIEVVYKAVEA